MLDLKRVFWNLSRLLFVTVLMFANVAHADLYCDPQIKARFEGDRQNAMMKDIARFQGAYGQANSFDSMYCGAQISSGFDSIGQTLVGGLTSQVNGLINQIFQKACKAAIAPIQNIASKTCIPNFAQSYLDPNLLNKVFGNQNVNNYCPGTQLIQVTPVISGPGFNGDSISTSPAFFW